MTKLLKNGFTVIELVVVMMIVMIIFAAATPRETAFQPQFDARDAAAIKYVLEEARQNAISGNRTTKACFGNGKGAACWGNTCSAAGPNASAIADAAGRPVEIVYTKDRVVAPASCIDFLADGSTSNKNILAGDLLLTLDAFTGRIQTQNAAPDFSNLAKSWEAARVAAGTWPTLGGVVGYSPGSGGIPETALMKYDYGWWRSRMPNEYMNFSWWRLKQTGSEEVLSCSAASIFAGHWVEAGGLITAYDPVGLNGGQDISANAAPVKCSVRYSGHNGVGTPLADRGISDLDYTWPAKAAQIRMDCSSYTTQYGVPFKIKNDGPLPFYAGQETGGWRGTGLNYAVGLTTTSEIYSRTHDAVDYISSQQYHCETAFPQDPSPPTQGSHTLASDFSGWCVGGGMKVATFKDEAGTQPTTAWNDQVKSVSPIPVSDATHCPS